MADMKDLESRIDELEIHLAHQDQMIEDLNRIIAEQWQDIRELTLQMGRLGSRIRSMEESGHDGPPPTEPPPPHY